MATKSFDDILNDADRLVRVWTANTDLALGDITLPSFKTKTARLRTLRGQAEDLRTQLTAVVNDANTQAEEISGITVRARSVARGQYGPDSTQYEQLGGTRASDRKPPKRKGGSGTPQS